jgi:hypothetical protein
LSLCRCGVSFTEWRRASSSVFAEKESPAARLRGERDITRQDAVNFIINGIVKGGGDTAVYPASQNSNRSRCGILHA